MMGWVEEGRVPETFLITACNRGSFRPFGRKHNGWHLTGGLR